MTIPFDKACEKQALYETFREPVFRGAVGLSFDEWVGRYAEKGDDYAEVLGEVVAEILEAACAKLPDEGLEAEAFVNAIHYLMRHPVEAAVDPLKTLWETRVLEGVMCGYYDDLHGRILTSLVVAEAVDVWDVWERERETDYAPLSFAYVRDRYPERIPETLEFVYQQEGLPEGLHTIAITYEDSAVAVFKASATYLAENGSPDIQGAFGAWIKGDARSGLSEEEKRDILALLPEGGERAASPAAPSGPAQH